MISNPEDRTANYKILFAKYDTDHDDLVGFNDLLDLVKEAGGDCTEAELQDLVNEAQINEKGQITEKDFLELMDRKMKQNDTEEELYEAFKIFDKDNSGLISAKKLLNVFQKIDSEIQEEEVLQIIKECDIDGDGYLDYNEFVRMVKNK